jgi:uncharacterized delta-60 repeat protein
MFRAEICFPRPASKETSLMWTKLLRLCLTRTGDTPRRPAPLRRPPSRLPSRLLQLEALEDRRLLNAGVLDPTFGNGAGYVAVSPTNGADYVYSGVIQPDSKILVAGDGYIMNSKNVSTAQDFAIIRYTANGSLDTAFGSGGTALANFGPINVNPNSSHPSVIMGHPHAALYPQSGTANDGKIVMAGWINKWWWSGQTNVNQYYFVLARFSANGTFDSTFGNQGEVITSLASLRNGSNVVIQPDGKIVVAGGTTTGFALARYNSNGTLDTGFGGGEVLSPLGQLTSRADALLLQPDGKLIVAGETPSSSTGGTTWVMSRYNADGSLDATFGNGGIVSGPFSGSSAEADGAALYPSGAANAGKIILAGDTAIGSGMARFNPDGSLDTMFGTGGEVTTTAANFRSVSITADGKLVLSGNNSTNAVIRYNADGSPDSKFGTGGIVTGPVAGVVALQSNGDIILAGSASNGTKSNFAVARYLPSDPEIGSFTASPTPVTSGSSTTLTAANITDANPNSTITQVAFYYYDSTGNKHVLGYGMQTSPGVWTLSYTVNLASGTYMIYAQVEDSYGVFGDPIALTLMVQ